jgi:hypothetical protein
MRKISVIRIRETYPGFRILDPGYNNNTKEEEKGN